MARTEAPTPVERVPEPRPVIAESPAVSPVTIQVAEPPPAPVAQAAVAPEPPPIIPPRFNADYLQNPAPAYPPLARRMHEQGKVLIRVLVSVDGLPERIELKASSGHARLDQSALETIRGWKFVPARQGSETVAAWVVVPITFSLDG
jgi:protein TonB